MKDEAQRDEQGNVRKAWVTEYLAHISDSEGLSPPPDEMTEDIARHLKSMDIGAQWCREFIGDMVVKMAIMWSVGGARREYALTGSTPAIRERVAAEADGFDASGTREDLVAWREWAFGKVGPHRRCSDLRSALDATISALNEAP